MDRVVRTSAGKYLIDAMTYVRDTHIQQILDNNKSHFDLIFGVYERHIAKVKNGYIVYSKHGKDYWTDGVGTTPRNAYNDFVKNYQTYWI